MKTKKQNKKKTKPNRNSDSVFLFDHTLHFRYDASSQLNGEKTMEVSQVLSEVDKFYTIKDYDLFLHVGHYVRPLGGRAFDCEVSEQGPELYNIETTPHLRFMFREGSQYDSHYIDVHNFTIQISRQPPLFWQRYVLEFSGNVARVWLIGNLGKKGRENLYVLMRDGKFLKPYNDALHPSSLVEIEEFLGS